MIQSSMDIDAVANVAWRRSTRATDVDPTTARLDALQQPPAAVWDDLPLKNGHRVEDDSLIARGIAAHKDPQTCNVVASAFDDGRGSWAVAARQRMDALQRRVVQDTNMTGVADQRRLYDISVPNV